MRLFCLAASLFLSSCAVVQNIPAVANTVANIVIDDSQTMANLESAMEKIAPASFVAPSILLEQARSRKVADLPPPATSDHRTPLPMEQAYSDLVDATVVVSRVYKCDHCPKWHSAPASGIVVGADGLIVTNFHVVEGRSSGGKSEQLVVAFRDGRVFPVQEVLAADKEADCALLRIAATGLKPVSLCTRSPAGTKVLAITHPAMHYWCLTQGVVSRHFLEAPRGQDGRRVERLAITADFAKGSSGGPIYNDCGELIGMVTYTQSIYYDTSNGTETNFQMTFKACVPSQSILDLFRKPAN